MDHFRGPSYKGEVLYWGPKRGPTSTLDELSHSNGNLQGHKPLPNGIVRTPKPQTLKP